ASVVASHSQETGHVLSFALHVGVDQAHVAFTTAPEYVCRTIQCESRINRIFQLCTSVSNDVEVRVGRSTVHVTGIGEQVSSTPKQFYARSLLLLLSVFNDGLQTLRGFSAGITLVNQVYIVEAVVRNTQFGDEFKCGVHFFTGASDRVSSASPWELERTRTERIVTCAAEGVPVCNGKFEVILHGFTGNHTILIVIFKR